MGHFFSFLLFNLPFLFCHFHLSHICIFLFHYSFSAEENDESSGLSAGAAAGVAVALTTLVMFVLGATSGGLVGWYITKKKTVFRVATESREWLVFERKSDSLENVEVEEQKDQ